MAVIAKKAGSVKALKASLKKRGNDQFIRNVPKEGITVRFIEEPDQWLEYKECYSKDIEPNFFPVFEGLDSDVIAGLERRPSKKYLTHVVDRSENKVIALKMPVTLVESIMKKYEKYNTVLDRDYELVKDGEGMGTTYEAIPEVPKRIKMDMYDPLDLEAVLESQIPAELGGGVVDDDDDDDNLAADDDDKPISRTRRPKPKPAPSGVVRKKRSTVAAKPKPGLKKKPLRKRG